MVTTQSGDGGKQGRIAQIRTAYRVTRQVDRVVGWVTLAWALAVLGIFVAVGFIIDRPIYLAIIGLPAALLAATIVFGRRVQKATFRQLDGQLGAGAAVLNSLRRGWTVTPAVAATRNQDVVHRVVGRPGIVLVGEGAPTRVGNLLANERKRTARYVPEVTITELVVGDGEGQVPLRKLQRKVMRLPRTLRPADVSEVNRRLRALSQTSIPIPKGPLPRNVKMPKTPRPR